ncbi:MAG TPA: sugar ABC transporter substrate-binding protein [Thermoanaerobaculia bacterium]|nr:sugar ABC transporter substrate-binding protein [Thermoanaerobaculia bacterium]
MRRAAAPAVLAVLLTAGACARGGSGREAVRFWGLGREGEVVKELLPAFHARHPDIRVEVQQIPWTAAHEKLLTAFVGESLPDLAQIGNTWLPEFRTLGALEDLGPRAARSSVVTASSYFPGIWDTNLVEGVLAGVPWYVDTRVLFYRKDLLQAAGIAAPPKTWAEWHDALRRLKARAGPDRWAILLPTDEWAQPVIFGLQAGASLLTADGGDAAFQTREFREAASFYVSLFREGLAPALANTQIANVYQEFAAGDFAMYVTGPWNLGEFRRRLPKTMEGRWSTAPLPSATGTGEPGVSLAGGSSLVLFRSSEKSDDAWKLIEFLSEPAQQVRFYALAGDLPARRDAWRDPLLSSDAAARAFEEQLNHVTATPRIPEWEQIAQKVAEHLEPAIRGVATVDAALASLDKDVSALLAKRRWVLARKAAHAR